MSGQYQAGHTKHNAWQESSKHSEPPRHVGEEYDQQLWQQNHHLPEPSSPSSSGAGKQDNCTGLPSSQLSKKTLGASVGGPAKCNGIDSDFIELEKTNSCIQQYGFDNVITSLNTVTEKDINIHTNHISSSDDDFDEYNCIFKLEL